MAISTRRSFLQNVGAAAATAALSNLGRLSSGAPESGKSGRKRPNVLFLFTDDQRWGTIHALGNDHIRTPHMDSLVRRGVSFMYPYIMGSTMGAVCVCSRACLMTGRTLWHVPRDIPESLALWPQVMREAGYATFGTGKWHNGRASYARGFTAGGKIFFGGMSNHLKVPVYDFDPSGKYPNNKRYIGKKFSSVMFADAAIKFLDEYKGDKPFFAYVSFTAPHDPRMAPKKYVEMYPPDKIPLPENFMPEHPFDNGEMKIRDEKLAPWPRTPAIVRRHIAAYYAMITHVDEQIGRILATLQERGYADNTIILFAGDNGLAVGRHGLMGKQNLYEDSIRVPLVMAGPAIPKGERRDALCYLHDLFPTVCEMTGIPVPGTVEGQSLLPVIEGKKEQVRDSVFAAYKGQQRSVRDERYKLIEYFVKGKRTTQLFDLSNDPWELRNLAGDPKYARRLARLRNRLAEWRKKCDDPALDKWSD